MLNKRLTIIICIVWRWKLKNWKCNLIQNSDTFCVFSAPFTCTNVYHSGITCFLHLALNSHTSESCPPAHDDEPAFLKVILTMSLLYFLSPKSRFTLHGGQVWGSEDLRNGELDLTIRDSHLRRVFFRAKFSIIVSWFVIRTFIRLRRRDINNY